MKYLILTIILTLSIITHSQVVSVEYHEEVFFSFQKHRSLIEQWENDEIIWGDALGFLNEEGVIRYVFDFDSMTVNLKYIHKDGKVGIQGQWNLTEVISEFDESTKHFSCVANTDNGDYFYELTKTVKDEFMLLRYYNNDNKKDVWALPSLDWDVYGIALGNVDPPKIKTY